MSTSLEDLLKLKTNSIWRGYDPTEYDYSKLNANDDYGQESQRLYEFAVPDGNGGIRYVAYRGQQNPGATANSGFDLVEERSFASPQEYQAWVMKNKQQTGLEKFMDIAMPVVVGGIMTGGLLNAVGGATLGAAEGAGAGASLGEPIGAGVMGSGGAAPTGMFTGSVGAGGAVVGAGGAGGVGGLLGDPIGAGAMGSNGAAPTGMFNGSVGPGGAVVGNGGGLVLSEPTGPGAMGSNGAASTGTFNGSVGPGGAVVGNNSGSLLDRALQYARDNPLQVIRGIQGAAQLGAALSGGGDSGGGGNGRHTPTYDKSIVEKYAYVPKQAPINYQQFQTLALPEGLLGKRLRGILGG